ncbi:hypothetical protein MMC30_002970 [Trapelia coarctata]|nr:hypothetical protein [Trapelia coarctata]
MPSQLPTSFASAAAPNGVSEGTTNGRSNMRGEGSGDWSRARINGATQTFRRPSVATSMSHQRDGSQSNNPSASSGVYVPPHLNSNYQSTFTRNSSTVDARYSKEQLLDLFRAQGESGSLPKNAAEHLIEGWNPIATGSAGNGTWNRRDDYKDGNSGPEICWDHEGSIQPLGLIDMSEEEKELFSNSVNSPLKAPTQNPNKEGTPAAVLNGRKSSISLMQNSGTAHGTGLQSGRPGPRRRETSDSLPYGNALASPTAVNRPSRDEPPISTPPPSLTRRRTDLKDISFGQGSGDRFGDNDKPDSIMETNSPFGSFKRTATGPLSANINGPASPWSTAPQSAGFPSTGAFGNFSLGGNSGQQPPTPGDRKLGFGSLRGESRFKGLMSKSSFEDMSSRSKDKTSISNMEKLTETDSEISQNKAMPTRSFRQSAELNPFDELDQHVGSAALGGEVPSPPSQYPFMQNPTDQSRPHDDIGFSAFGSASNMPSFRDMIQRRGFSQQQTPQGSQYSGVNPHEPMSPTNTNPYQSPEGEKQLPDDIDHDASDGLNMHQNIYNPGANASRQFNAAFEGAASDRSQNSSVGPTRGFPNPVGLNSYGPWSAAPAAGATPNKQSTVFPVGDSIFSAFGDGQSPGYGVGGPFYNPSSSQFGSIGTIGRGSKMGSLFPTAMQDQMQGNDLSRPDHGHADATQLGSGRNAFAANAPGFSNVARETDSPSRQGRGMLDDLFGNLEGRGRSMQNVSSPFSGSDATSNTFSQTPSTATQIPVSMATTAAGHPPVLTPPSSSLLGRSPETDNSSGMPATQQRQMVMPDRMRWIYRDPQGNTQGPWSGLEMHDWYKAGFFSPELQVKKLEDADYEPLAQLIRRIGNSREPFLVPQIGIPHGSASTQTSTNPSVLGAVPAASPSVQGGGAAQPPFASSFPSFGTTLTAEQQNALERRKQEEQYLMARQKEHLAQQQVLIKQMQHMGGVPHGMHPQQLHHHSSAHSLQSQPSYGSITSPTGYQPSPAQGQLQQHGSVGAFFETQPRSSVLGVGPVGVPPIGLHSGQENEMAAAMDRLNVGRTAQTSFGNSSQSIGPQEGGSHQQQVALMLQDRARLQREQERFDLTQRTSIENNHETLARFEQYKQLRTQEEEQLSSFPTTIIGQPIAPQITETKDQITAHDAQNDQDYPYEQERRALTQESAPLVIPELPRTTTAPTKQPTAIQTQSPWATVDAGLPMPFPPPQSASPLPAPAAQRARHNVADALAAESRSRSQTPSVETPSAALAPWAKENLETLKGPSLKEIQEAEARQTAQQEEIAAAARRALAEQERQNQIQPIIPTAGLPSTVNWASSTSPATPTSAGPSAWAKPLAGKQAVAGSASTAKKTLAQIQKEEETRKNRAAAAAAANAANNLAGIPTLPGGKRYADLAGKVASPVTPGMTGAWTTVGAGGKLKTPVGLSSATPSVPKALSSGSLTSVAAAVKSKPIVAPVRSNTAGGSSSAQSANDELYKWAKGALGKGLNASINVDDFVRNLLQLPSEPEILSEAVYANSPTLDGRRFADEFIRRRKLADKGIIPETSSNTSVVAGSGSESKNSGGWSEVAKKGPANGGKEEPASAFKVVAAKKKGKR